MSIRKKLLVSFFLMAGFILIISFVEFNNLQGIKRQVFYLELTDSIRSKSLQLRRYEKNYLLYGSPETVGLVYKYIRELKSIINEQTVNGKESNMKVLSVLIEEYSSNFGLLDTELKEISSSIKKAGSENPHYKKFIPIIERSLEHPLELSDMLDELKVDDIRLKSRLLRLNDSITTLRKNGEDIVNLSREYDKAARRQVEGIIAISYTIIGASLFIFFVFGSATLLYTNVGIARRLKLLMDNIESTGKGIVRGEGISDKNITGNDEIAMIYRKFEEITGQIVKWERLLEEKNNELFQSQKLAAIGTLASGVAHEINNPLNNIFLSVQILSRDMGGSIPPHLDNMVKDILKQTQRVKKIVSDLLEYSKEMRFEVVKTDMKTIIQSAFNQITKTGINFAITGSSNKLSASIDPDRMERVFINLFNNAIDAMGDNGSISVTLEDSEKNVIIHVSDTGCGIKEDDMKKIFDPFYSTRSAGTGLGLSIVNNIIKRHNGEIKVKSSLHNGTTFTLTLPKGEGDAV